MSFLHHVPSLSIKSQAGSSASNAKPAYAVLCTRDKTFQLRQVQTSNSLFITQPALEAHGNEIPIPATRAIASCTATLELHPSDASAESLLRDVLPVYDIVAGDVDATGNNMSKAVICEDVPLSEGQCNAGWNALIAFEHENSSYQPSANALAQVWRSINAAALAEGVKLDSQFLTDDITRAVAEEDHPPGLVNAILTFLAKDGDADDSPWSCLDRAKTVAFAGKTLLEAKQGSDFLVPDFTDTWEDKLPEAWRKDVQLSAIDRLYELPSPTTIRATSKAGNAANATAVANKPSARKWHERFGKTRKK
jgi:sister chromatid cohesion protein DCC1